VRGERVGQRKRIYARVQERRQRGGDGGLRGHESSTSPRLSEAGIGLYPVVTRKEVYQLPRLR